jgi:hypothetical protein
LTGEAVLAKVAVSATLFDEEVGGDFWHIQPRHERITALLARYGQIVCAGADELRRLRDLASQLPRTIRPFWDPILFGDPHHLLMVSPPAGQKRATEISTETQLRAWKGAVDVLLAGDAGAERLGLATRTGCRTDAASGIEICRPPGLATSRLGHYETINGTEADPSLGKDALWSDFIGPLYAPAREVVIVDQYAGNFVPALEWLWQRLADVPPPGGPGRRLTILSGNLTPRNMKKEKAREVAHRRRTAAEQSLARLTGTGGIAEARIHWVPEAGWKRATSSGGEVRVHDRHIRFDKRTLSVSSGMEWVAKPDSKECRLTYECKGDRQPEGFARLDRKEAWLRVYLEPSP